MIAVTRASHANDVVLNYNIENICLLDSSFIFIIRSMYSLYRLFANSNRAIFLEEISLLNFIYIYVYNLEIIWKNREKKFYINFIYYSPEEYFIKHR